MNSQHISMTNTTLYVQFKYWFRVQNGINGAVYPALKEVRKEALKHLSLGFRKFKQLRQLN